MAATRTDWAPHFEHIGATWTWSGNPKHNHVGTIKSSTHARKYSNSDQIVRDPKLVRAVARELADAVLEKSPPPNWVVGHAPYAEAPAFALAEEFQDRGYNTNYGFSARDEEGGYSTRFLVRPGETVLAIADDVVTGDSTRKTIRDLLRHGAVMLGAIPCLANLSDEDRLTVDFPDGLPEGYIEQPNLESLEFIAAATYAGVAYAREACQPCADGSRAIDPRKNWDFLMSQVPPAAATA